MDSSKRMFRFSLEPLDPREVPAQLGVVELPDAAAPTAQVALTAPHDLGKGPEAGIKIDGMSLNFSKITYGRIVSDLVSQKIDLAGDASPTSDPASAGKVSMQDFHFTKSADAGKVAMQDFHFVMKVNKASPLLF